MYTAAGQGQTTPWDKMLMSTETSCHFGHLLQVSKWMDELGFYVPSTVFQSFRDDGRVNMKGSVQ